MHSYFCMVHPRVTLAFRVTLNGMTKVATPLLASSSSFLTRNTCFYCKSQTVITANIRLYGITHPVPKRIALMVEIIARSLSSDAI